MIRDLNERQTEVVRRYVIQGEKIGSSRNHKIMRQAREKIAGWILTIKDGRSPEAAQDKLIELFGEWPPRDEAVLKRLRLK